MNPIEEFIMATLGSGEMSSQELFYEMGFSNRFAFSDCDDAIDSLLGKGTISLSDNYYSAA